MAKVVKKHEKLKTFACYGIVSGSKYLGDVQAIDEADAKTKAEQLEEMGVNLCHQCANECEDPEVTDIEVLEKIEPTGTEDN